MDLLFVLILYSRCFSFFCLFFVSVILEKVKTFIILILSYCVVFRVQNVASWLQIPISI